MAVIKKAAKSKKLSKKEKIAAVSALLKPVLAKFENEIGEKKFEKKIKEAAKLFAGAMKSPAASKAKPVVKKAKAAKKAPASKKSPAAKKA
ncbi:MAG TPA: hypothetical protein PLY34_15430 [Ferruginibacter sp.]|nr:hypothetical protein [Ferruginibacter sp.]HPH92258.1 hypothetical protein [Ferruginibacter sp.]